jgi:methyl-accepting chemotaxis protein
MMKSIKTKIIAGYVAAILIIAIILGVLAVSISQNAVVNEVENGLQALADQGAKLVASRLETQLRILESIANIREIRDMYWATQQKELQRQEQQTDFLALAVVRQDGIAYYSDDTTAELGDREYVKKAFEGIPNVSEVLVSRVTNELVLMFAVPIIKGENIVGVLIGRCDGNTLSDITNDIVYGETGYAYIIDDDGTVVAHPDREKVESQWNPLTEAENDSQLRSIADEFSRMLGDGKAAIGSYTLEGEEYYNAYAHVEGTNWHIAVTVLKSEALSSIATLAATMTTVLLVILLAGAVLSYFMGKSFAGPIIDLTSIVGRFADYDLSIDENSQAFKYMNRKDEIGSITKALYKMQTAFIDLLKQARVSSEIVGAASDELSSNIQEISSSTVHQAATTEELSSSIEEMTAGIQVINENMQAAAADVNIINRKVSETEEMVVENSRNLEDINKSIETILDALSETRSSIHTITEQSRTASKEADSTVSLTREGKENLDRTVQQMSSIQTTIQSLASVINQLGESASRIGDITDLIKDVAEQTNLLALNASIEAARAGEHGKGFAVVAQAIGKLAEESQNATSEIADVIKNIQLEISKAVKSSKEGTMVVENGTRLVQETSDSLEKIFGAIQITSEAIQGITSLMNVQTRETDEIYHAANDIGSRVSNLMASMEAEAASLKDNKNSIDSINKAIYDIGQSLEQQSAVSEEVSRAVNDNAAGIEQISSGSEEIARSAEELAQSAQMLIEQVQKFKL